MLQSVDIRNFQRHKKLLIDFDPRVTTIIGSNGAGKTAILRALHWLCFNRPAGTTFIRRGTKRVRVKLFVDEHTVERRRTEENLYRLDNQQFKAFGSNVPDEIANILKVRPENFQGQLDAPFWLTLSPGQVSQEMNAIVDLGLVDRSLAFVLKELRQQKAKQKVLEERVESAKRERDELSFVVRLHKDLSDIERLNSKIEEIALQRDGLQECVKSIESVVRTRETTADAVRIGGQRLSSLNKLRVRLDETQKHVNKFISLLADLQSKQSSRERIRKELKQTESELHKVLKGKCPVCGKQMSNE